MSSKPVLASDKNWLFDLSIRDNDANVFWEPAAIVIDVSDYVDGFLFRDNKQKLLKKQSQYLANV